MIDGFLMGVIATTSLIAGLFFLKFWKRTSDMLFLAFGSAFIIEGLNRVALLFTSEPSEANPWFYLVRALAFLLIIAGILKKNFE
jgi:uncharacterized membrane protein HdeD (DUF308 family)